MNSSALSRPLLQLDHITVTAGDLAEGVAHVREAIGIELPAGGKHPEMGTHNHLLRLGPGLFLEVIAVDTSAAAPQQPRWFGLDRPQSAPALLSTWVVRTEDMDGTLADERLPVGRAKRVSRGSLSWRITVPDDGSLPLDGAFPTVIEWPPGPHPAAGMPDLGCTLIRLEIEHPEARRIKTLLQGGFQDDRVVIADGPESRLQATIRTPHGLRTLR